MRLLHLAFIVALASGVAAILIYITGVSNLSVFPFVFSELHLQIFYYLFSLIWCYNCYSWVDGTLNISDEEMEALQSLQSGFQKCVVSFSYKLVGFLIVNSTWNIL